MIYLLIALLLGFSTLMWLVIRGSKELGKADLQHEIDKKEIETLGISAEDFAKVRDEQQRAYSNKPYRDSLLYPDSER